MGTNLGLHDICAKERIAGYKLPTIRHIMLDVVRCVRTLHMAGICHADLKQRNIVRRKGKMVLVDLDAAARMGTALGDKCSTAYCAPERARAKFAAAPEPVIAAESYDVWHIGVSRNSFFKFLLSIRTLLGT